MALTPEELQVLRFLGRSPEGRSLVAMLEQKLAVVDVKLRTASGEELYRKQGRAQQLEELLREITEADAVIKRQEPSKRLDQRNWTQP